MADDQPDHRLGEPSGWGGWLGRTARPLAVGLVVWPLIGCDPLSAMFEDVQRARRYRSEGEAGRRDPERLTVMTWNIKFAGDRIRFFYQCDGERVHMQRREVVDHLEGIARKIRQTDPDVLFLQEVDVDSKRSAYVDQVDWLLRHTDLSHAVYASQWNVPYVPKKWLGPVDSGNAILTKWPLDRARRIALPLIAEQDPVTQYFYLKRNILKARLEPPGRAPVWLLNTHFSAFSQDGTRARQVRRFEQLLRSLDRRDESFVAGGDLNLLPPVAKRARDFPDVRCRAGREASDYTETLDYLESLYEDWQAAVPLETYGRSPRRFHTFTSDPEVFWTRKLDHLFTNRSFAEDSAMVHQNERRGGVETIRLSDHAPLTVDYPTEPAPE